MSSSRRSGLFRITWKWFTIWTSRRKSREEIGHEDGARATAGTHPSFVKMIRELILERVDNVSAAFCGSARRGHCCPPDCCC